MMAAATAVKRLRRKQGEQLVFHDRVAALQAAAAWAAAHLGSSLTLDVSGYDVSEMFERVDLDASTFGT